MVKYVSSLSLQKKIFIVILNLLSAFCLWDSIRWLIFFIVMMIDNNVISNDKQFYLSLCSVGLFVVFCIYAEFRAWKLFCHKDNGYISLSFVFFVQLIVAVAVPLVYLVGVYCLVPMIEWSVRQFSIKGYLCDVVFVVALNLIYFLFFRSFLIKTLANKPRSLAKSVIICKVLYSALYAISMFLVVCFLVDIAEEMLLIHLEDNNYKIEIYLSVLFVSWFYISYRICRLWQPDKKTGFLQLTLIQLIVLAILIAINQIDYLIINYLIEWVSVENNRLCYTLCFFTLFVFINFFILRRCHSIIFYKPESVISNFDRISSVPNNFNEHLSRKEQVSDYVYMSGKKLPEFPLKKNKICPYCEEVNDNGATRCIVCNNMI